MEETSKNNEIAQLGIGAVMCSTWKPTINLRWLEGKNYIPQLDSFERELQQLWVNDKGEEEWRDIDVHF